MDLERIEEVLGEFSSDERNEIYAILVKKEQEKAISYYKQLRAICTKPFLSLEESHSYQVDQRVKCIKALPTFVKDFHESAERGKKDKNSYKKEAMKRTADSFAFMGMLHGKEFPEKEKIKLDRDNVNSDPIYLNYLFYLGLVLSIPKELEPHIEIHAEYRIPIIKSSEVYYADFALLRKYDNELMYIIECDEKYHDDEDQKVKDKNREIAIKCQFPQCKICRIPEEEIYLMKSPDVSAIKRAKQFWDQVAMESDMVIKDEGGSDLVEETSFSKGIFKRLFLSR